MQKSEYSNFVFKLAISQNKFIVYLEHSMTTTIKHAITDINILKEIILLYHFILNIV